MKIKWLFCLFLIVFLFGCGQNKVISPLSSSDLSITSFQYSDNECFIAQNPSKEICDIMIGSYGRITSCNEMSIKISRPNIGDSVNLEQGVYCKVFIDGNEDVNQDYWWVETTEHTRSFSAYADKDQIVKICCGFSEGSLDACQEAILPASCK
jgi:hypothetical protein